MPFLKYKRSKLKLRVFLAGHSVAMVTYCITKIIPTYSPVIGRCFDTIIVASSDKEWLIMTNQNLSLRMCWKLFWATLRAIIWSTLFNYCVQPILENTGLVRLVQVYWSRLRLRPWTLPQGDKTWSKSLAWWKSMYTKTFKVRLIHAAFEMLFDWGVQVLPQTVVFWRRYCWQGEIRFCVMQVF